MMTSSFALLLVLNPSSNTYGSSEILGQHQQQQQQWWICAWDQDGQILEGKGAD